MVNAEEGGAKEQDNQREIEEIQLLLKKCIEKCSKGLFGLVRLIKLPFLLLYPF